jgi:hypothetical protein
MENSDNKKYKIEFLDEEGNVKKTITVNSIKNFARDYELNYYAVRSILNEQYLNKTRKPQKYIIELSKKIKISDSGGNFFEKLNI